MTTIMVRVPMEPPHGLSPNRRLNPAAPGLRKAWKAAWSAAAKETIGEHQLWDQTITTPVVLTYRYWKGKGKQSWDDDNLIAVCKHGRDQLQATGILKDDNLVKQTIVEQLRAPDGIGRLDVLITPLKDAPNPVEIDGNRPPCPRCHGSRVVTYERYGPDLWVMGECSECRAGVVAGEAASEAEEGNSDAKD